MSAERTDGLREHWVTGETAWFEYHCMESHDSMDADLWYHSHQQVTVLDMETNDATPDMTLDDRFECATQHTYTVRFADGMTGCVMEDELMESPATFYRPDPPIVATVIGVVA